MKKLILILILLLPQLAFALDGQFIPNVRFTRSTTTSATSTNLFSTNASTTRLWLGTGACDTLDTDAAGFVSCGTDSVGVGADWPWSVQTTYSTSTNSTTTPTWFQTTFYASSTSGFPSVIDNFLATRSTTTHATTTSFFSTVLTATTGFFTNVFIGADSLAEYISDTAGAFFTGNTETGVTVTYQDADNTVDVVCNTADTSTFGCLTDTDWDTFNNKESVLTFGDGLTRTVNDVDFDGGDSPQGELGGTWASPTLDDNVTVTGWTLGNFLGTNATITSATTTNFSAINSSTTNATTSNFFGADLSTCQSGSFLTWTAGRFGCDTDDNSGGGTDFPSVLSWGNATSTRLGFLNGFLSTASSTVDGNLTITGNSTTTSATTTSLFSTNIAFTNLLFDSEVFDSLTDDATLDNNGGDLRVVDVTCTDCLTSTEIDSSLALSATTLTVAGTAGQITSSAGAQDLTANRTWTLSLPSFVQITNLTVTNSTTTNATTTSATSTNFFTTNASTTNFYGADLATCQSGSFLTWTAGRFGCDTDDNSGGGVWPWFAGSTYGTTTNATTTPTWFQTAFYASSTTGFPSVIDALRVGKSTTTAATSTVFNISTQGGLTIGSNNWPVSTSTTVCDIGCPYTSIQSALNAGWLNVHVKHGTYAEQITIQNSKTILWGDDLNTIIRCDGATQNPCITTNGKDEFEMYGFTVDEANDQLVGVGLDLSNGSIHKIHHNRFSNFATSTLYADTLNNSFYTTISDNTFFNPRACVDISGVQANANWIRDNRCRPMGIDGGFGAYIVNARGITLSGDWESTSTAFTTVGIYVASSSREVTIENPWVEALGTGLQVEAGANRTTVVGGTFSSNGTDISDSGTQTVFLNTSDTGVTVNKFGRATSSAFAITSITSCTEALETTATGDIICGTDADSGGGGAADTKWATSTGAFAGLFPNGGNNVNVGIGTSTPYWPLTVASSSGSQLTLSDADNSFNHWSFRNVSGNFYLATSSRTTFATSTAAALKIDSVGDFTFAQHLFAPAGGSGAAAYSFVGDPNTGIYSGGTDVLSVAAGGVGVSWTSASSWRPNTNNSGSVGDATHFWKQGWFTNSTSTYATSTSLYAGTASTTDLFVGNSISILNSGSQTTLNGLCIALTGSSELCDGDDGGGGSGGEDFTYSNDNGYGITGSATTTNVLFSAGLHASTTSHFSNATSTLFTILNGFWVGSSRWDNGSGKIDGEQIADDTIDDDSIDFVDVTIADFTGVGGNGVIVNGDALDFDCSDVTDSDANDGITCATEDIILDTTDNLTWTGSLILNSITRSTTTQSTSTSHFATTASSTNLFTSAFNFGQSVLSLVQQTITAGANAILDFGSAVSLEIPNGTGPTVDATGEVAVDTTSDQFIYYGASSKRVLQPYDNLGFAYATSTWTGTSTLRIGPSPAAITVYSALCETNTGTVGVSLYDGTNRANYIPTASTTINENLYTSNNTFTKGETIRVDIGTPASSPQALSCRFLYTYTAD